MLLWNRLFHRLNEKKKNLLPKRKRLPAITGSLFHLINYMKINYPIFCLLLLGACHEQRHETVAHITQRRIKTNGMLEISYQYHNGQRLVLDSMELVNRIVPHDSLPVVFSPGTPSQSHLLIP